MAGIVHLLNIEQDGSSLFRGRGKYRQYAGSTMVQQVTETKIFGIHCSWRQLD